MLIAAQIAVTVLCIVIVISGCKYFDDAAEVCVLFTGCIAGHFVFYQAPLTSAQAVAIFAGCVVGHFIYKNLFRK